MIFSILVLLTAVLLSSVSAYYSIVGLTAIFAAAYWPIVIMGGTLELSKIMATLWLHYNWERADWKIRSYLVGAVCMLMLITSMGTFGFLSKSHLDQAVPSGDIQAQVSLFDEKIKTERDNIDADRKALAQLDTTVDQLMARTTDDKGAIKATDLRRSQRKERNNINHDIEVSQQKITQLQEVRSPVASMFRKAEADVGPIRYIAALLYGDHPSQDTLESAVRIVIIIIVLVFDPLAIVLLLASTTSIDWIKNDRLKENKVEEDKEESVPEDKEAILTAHQKELDQARAEERKRYDELLQSCADQTATEEELSAAIQSLKKITEDFNALVPTVIDLEEECAALVVQDNNLKSQLRELINGYDDLLDEKHLLDGKILQLDKSSELAKDYTEQLTLLKQEITDKDSKITSTENSLEHLRKVIEEKNIELLEVKKEFMGHEETLSQEISNRDITIKDLYTALQREIDENNLLRNTKAKEPEEVIVPTVQQPITVSVESSNLVATADTKLPVGGNASFGVIFPTKPLNGDLFLRVDFLPAKLFKWIGSRWIEVDKSITNAYAFDDQYIKMLVEKVRSGEYSVEDLNDIEQEQVAKYLNSSR